MAGKKDNNDLTLEDLIAFADGELDTQRHEHVLRLLALNPQAMRQVAFHHQLRQALRKSVESRLPGAPPLLQSRIRALLTNLEDNHYSSESASSERGNHFWGWLVTLPAVAAALVVALGAIMTIQSLGSTLPVDAPAADVPVLSTIAITALAHQHDLCAKNLDNLHHTELFPQQVDKLVPSIARFLGFEPYNDLNLLPLGYQFAGVGSCMAPGHRSVHIVYQPTDPTSHRGALSLWVVLDDGSMPNIKSDTPYATADVHSAAPILFWKHSRLMYYLVSTSSEGMKDVVHFFVSKHVVQRLS